ncbi:hypothetical protein CPB84DRAFT_1843953 [Gymnopilus junonius]|uniref:Uncharacterized protein n=1 Tax=Gymnopilus junonius TaxID=109634 RepID=A0A9P5NUW6_GYMJU|nr:hypothetical protein CPB84DRAFT_1843953 [Gymnopilus junonius]
MTGANYMGGKRNTMKARAKDAIGRIQKGFFGRQKFDMLYQGLSSSSKPTPTGKLTPGTQKLVSLKEPRLEIDLAHARKKIPIDDDSTGRFIPSPIHVAPSTPRSRKQLKAHSDAHTSSSPSVGRKKSKVLDILDTSEPIFLRRVMDEILAMPDLACLSTGKDNERASTDTGRGEKRKRLEEDDFNPRTKVPLLALSSVDSRHKSRRRRSGSRGRPASLLYWTSSSSGTRRHGASRSSLSSLYCENDDLDDTYSNIASNDNHSKRISEDSHTSGPSSSVYDSGFSMTHYLDKANYSSPWSMQRLQPSSSRTSECATSSEREDSTNPWISPRNDRIWFSLPPSSPGRDEDPISEAEEWVKEFPSVVRLGPEDGETCVYGKLFEQSDPWRTVGFILGLHDLEAGTGEGKEDWREPVESKHPFEDVWGAEDMNGQATCDVPLFEDGWAIEDGLSDTDLVMDDAGQERQHGYVSPTPGGPMSIVESLSDEGSVFERRQSSPVRQIDTAEEMEMDDPEKVEAVMQHSGDDEKSPDIFSIPNLREVDGRILGPLLFDNFDESEDEQCLDFLWE